MATTYLTRTFAAGNRKTWTLSGWFKFANVNSDMQIFGFSTGANDASTFDFVRASSGALRVDHWTEYKRVTNRVFRDTNAWYHIVLRVDTTQSTANDRIRIYVNGVQETSFATLNNPALNEDFVINSNTAHFLGVRSHSSSLSLYYNGLMSHVHFSDGQSLAPTVFGSTDATTGEWVINTSPSFTLGTNGFTILQNGNTITDQSSNSNDWTLGGGTLTNTEDCPDDVFCTLNNLVKHQGTINHGNTRYDNGGTGWFGVPATLGNSTGKFYWEIKLTTITNWTQNGIVSNIGYNALNGTYVGNITNGVAMNTGGGDIYTAGSSAQAWFGSARSQGQIIGVALDLDNNKIYWSCDGVWGNSSNPSTGSNGYSIPSALTDDKPIFPAASVENCVVDYNFGNGYFGTSAIASEGTNASNIGKFEYDIIPSTATALSTKGLNN